jgi:hypothetical protein
MKGKRQATKQENRIMTIPLPIEVSCTAGYRGEETPRQIKMGERVLNVDRVIDRWLAPDHRYFKFDADDGGRYIIRHDIRTSRWELIYYTAAADRSDRPPS